MTLRDLLVFVSQELKGQAKAATDEVGRKTSVTLNPSYCLFSHFVL